jgi:hypothetical protein
MRVAERSDRIEPLLVGHDKQDVRPSHNVMLIPQLRGKNLGSISDQLPEQKQTRDVSLRST